MEAKKLQDNALKRLNKLRQIVHNQNDAIGTVDDTTQLQGGGELYFVNTQKSRAYYLCQNDSWIYLERDNDGTCGTLYIVRRLPDGRIVTKIMQD